MGGGGEPHIDMKSLNYETAIYFAIFIDGEMNSMNGIDIPDGNMKEFTLTKRECYSFLPYKLNKSEYDIEKVRVNGITHIITENSILNISLVFGTGNNNEIYFIKKKK